MQSNDTKKPLRDDLRHSLIVSCQPVPAGPTDNTDFVIGFARAAVAAGAKAVRIESIRYVKAVRPFIDVPIIGIVKRDLDDSPVRITPFISDVDALADAGADIIAFDATDRVRPASVASLLDAVHRRGKLAMADCSSLEDARQTLALGVDFVGTTLSGYVGGPVPDAPDIGLITAMRQLTPYVIAEGRVKAPADAAQAAQAGAFAVVVGSAITRTEHITQWFREAMENAYASEADLTHTHLAFDIGGTKVMAALVRGSEIIDSITMATARDAGPETWLRSIYAAMDKWQIDKLPIGIAVTGVVRNGFWSALNPGTLAIPDNFPLVETASRLFGNADVLALNDAQAAAWGEYRHGAGAGCSNMAFLTVSTGIGGGLVLNGRLLGGLAGHFGQIGSLLHGAPLENTVSGRWMEAEAHKTGHAIDAKGVFAAKAAGEAWAASIVRNSAQRIAGLCCDIKLALDVERIVIGGGVGLAEDYIEMVREFTNTVPPHLRPEIIPAALGGNAGIVGAADLAFQKSSSR
ncbi:putative N-acetylmannosamine-6-phosphate 2-epimerase [Brucellaceae bacterium D45D]